MEKELNNNLTKTIQSGNTDQTLQFHTHNGTDSPRINYNDLENIPTVYTDITATNNKDTTLYSAAATTNYGTDTTISARDNTSDEMFNILINFTLPDRPAGNSTITKVSLWLKQSTALTYNGYIFVHELTQTAWTENGATWNKYDGTNDWTAPGGDYDSTIIDRQEPPGAGYWREFILMDEAEPEFNHNPLDLDWGDELNLIVRTVDSATEDGDTGAIWHSKEAASAADRPYIKITYS